MIDLHTWSTPNGRKISIALEELAIPYRVHPIDINKGEQFSEAFLAISPNNRIPAIFDAETGISLIESGAILLYLAEKSGRLLPPKPELRWQAVQWSMWQMGGFGPMLGQVHHFVKYNPGRAPYAEERLRAECRRLYGVLDRRLSSHEYLADQYSIADIAVWPWASRFAWQQVDLSEFPNVVRWYRATASRPAVVKRYHVPVFTGVHQ